MYELFARTLSQGLQASMPIAIFAAWLRRRGDAARLAAVRGALLAAIPLTLLAGWLFLKTDYQARWEALLAIAGSGLAFVFFTTSMRPRQSADRSAASFDRRPVGRQLAIGAALVLIIVRQAMEIAAVLGAAAIETHSFDAAAVVLAGALLAIIAAAAWTWVSDRLSDPAALNATRAFAAFFLAQIFFYAVHKSAEARFLPWGEVLDAATEPYGPDSRFGYAISSLLVGVPLAGGLLTVTQEALRRISRRQRILKGPALTSAAIAVNAAIVAALCVLVAAATTRDSLPRRASAPAAPSLEATNISAVPHLLFRETGIDKTYGLLSVAPLAMPAAARAAVDMRCERLSFAAGRGLCLQADRRAITTYKATIFDGRFRPLASIPLDGSPSRTRISADGRVGAITVFVTGQTHGYVSSRFSTKTILLNMATGDVVGDLEKFATWRNGARFSAADFNFWGVTFARDSNVFYATLKTAGQTYLVRGDVALRELTVLRENVECPSLSPDNRLIAFKKRIGPSLAPWRLYVLDLGTMKEWAVAAETRSYDDQIEWLDDGHVLYAMPSAQPATSDVWMAAIAGSDPARVFLPRAESPIVVR